MQTKKLKNCLNSERNVCEKKMESRLLLADPLQLNLEEDRFTNDVEYAGTRGQHGRLREKAPTFFS